MQSINFYGITNGQLFHVWFRFNDRETELQVLRTFGGFFTSVSKPANVNSRTKHCRPPGPGLSSSGERNVEYFEIIIFNHREQMTTHIVIGGSFTYSFHSHGHDPFYFIKTLTL